MVTLWLRMAALVTEAKEHAECLIASEGLEYVNGYDDPPIVAWAGTIGIEIIEDVPCADAWSAPSRLISVAAIYRERILDKI